MNGDKSGVGVWNGSAYTTRGIPAPGTNWHHLVMVFDNDYAEVFWDGVSRGSFFAPRARTGTGVALHTSEKRSPV